MPSTNFPFGVSATTVQRTVAGEGYFQTVVTTSAASFQGAVNFTNTVTVGSATGITNMMQAIPVYFAASSALQQIAVTTGIASCSIDAVYLTFSTVSALVAAYTVQVGSAGAVAVATVSNTTASVGVAQSLTTTLTTFNGTSSALVCIRSVQGTAGDTVLTLLFKQTA